ncbi:MAG: F0F1 ATP synthase subunit gamma [Brachybacterium sp.]|nr:F0F1 ATP synthase subunit gamma [Brachybacterium sp.]
MGAQQRVYKKRIRSAQGMKKIFKAQEMIAAARIAKAHERVLATTPYAEAITQAIGALAAHSRDPEHPFLRQDRHETGHVVILLITADRGMAGSYSSNTIREAEQLTNKLEDQGKTVELYVVGRKGDTYYRFRNRPPVRSWTPYKEDELPTIGREISEHLQERLLSEDPEVHLDELYVVGTRFRSRFQQTAQAVRMVPLQVAEAPKDAVFPLYEFVPDVESVFDELVPRYVTARLVNILLQSMASEHAARQRAMQTAVDNAEQQARKFTRLANSARQAEITQEITEIVGGADALAGSGRTVR